MENPKAEKLLNKIQRELQKNGIVVETITTDLKELRTIAVEETNPLVAKVIRLTHEHLESYGTFNIPIPEDEPLEEFETETEEQSDFDPQESLDYLLSLILESENKRNELELREYCDELITFAEEN